MRSGYDVLGNHIQLVDQRNVDQITDNVLGISIEKRFMPSVANLVGTDLSRYKLITKGLFACNPMHVGRDERLPVALYTDAVPSIVSPAYFVFEIIDKSILNEEYLMLWFQRPEFDRESWFMTDSTVRGGLSWEDFCRMELPVPPYEEQLKIVSRFNSISNRISLLQNIDDNLKESAKIILRKEYWSEDSFYDNMTTLDAFCDTITSGGTPNRGNPAYWNSNDYYWLKNGEIKNNIIIDTEESISELGFSESSTKLIPANSVSMAMYCVSDIQVSFNSIPLCTNQAVINFITDNLKKSIFIYYLLMGFGNEITTQANGSAQQNLSKKILNTFKFKNPRLDAPLFSYLEKNITLRLHIKKEIEMLMKLKEMMLLTLN